MEMTVLKNKWGKYCDVEKLCHQMTGWFSDHNIRNTVNGTCDMLDKFFENKEDLIQMLQSSEHYIGDLRIELDTQMCRYNDRNQIYSFVSRFYDNAECHKAILKTVDANGKKLNDYLKIGKKNITIDELVAGKLSKPDFSKWSEVFNSEGYTVASNSEANDFYNLLNIMKDVYTPTISSSKAEYLNTRNDKMKVVKGTKTTRVFNKICNTYGVDKLPKYNKLFAEYADMLSESKRDIKFYISVNPIDYLTMSNGYSWKSCHAHGGGWFGGTVSYMLDSVSFITYVFNERPENFATQGKIYRNMFHYQNRVLLQSRVYPQGNDGCTDLYNEFKEFVCKEIADILGKENNWHKTEVGINSFGNHYKDYNNANFRKVYSLGSTLTTTMDIGHTNICPYCGREEDTGSCSKISHLTCQL